MNIKVYVAGPISGSGNQIQNVREALFIGEELMTLGYFPYLPHRDHLDQLVTGLTSWDHWMRQDKAWLEVCDIVLRLPGASPGADQEEAWAHELNIPVVFSLPVLKKEFPCTPPDPS